MREKRREARKLARPKKRAWVEKKTGLKNSPTITPGKRGQCILHREDRTRPREKGREKKPMRGLVLEYCQKKERSSSPWGGQSVVRGGKANVGSTVHLRKTASRERIRRQGINILSGRGLKSAPAKKKKEGMDGWVSRENNPRRRAQGEGGANAIGRNLQAPWQGGKKKKGDGLARRPRTGKRTVGKRKERSARFPLTPRKGSANIAREEKSRSPREKKKVPKLVSDKNPLLRLRKKSETSLVPSRS